MPLGHRFHGKEAAVVLDGQLGQVHASEIRRLHLAVGVYHFDGLDLFRAHGRGNLEHIEAQIYAAAHLSRQDGIRERHRNAQFNLARDDLADDPFRQRWVRYRKGEGTQRPGGSQVLAVEFSLQLEIAARAGRENGHAQCIVTDVFSVYSILSQLIRRRPATPSN